jgi:CIC family chloride channel protein
MSIGTGASIGREGPIVQIDATLASKLGQLFRVRRERLSILVGCGVAAGLAAAYNVPIAASFFVMEIIIGNFAIDIFAPLVISSVLSTLVYRKMFGNDPVYGTPHFTLFSEWELLIYVLLGILAGIAAVIFRKVMSVSEHRFNKIPGPFFLKSALGGLLIGVIGLMWPHVWGNGFDAVNLILKNELPYQLLFVLFLMKIIATAISVGSGASGGVFTPAQFVGAALGGFLGFAANQLFPQQVALPSAYALVGMGCLIAGTTYAPIMGILMIFEMTLDYEIILPLMLSCIISSSVARYFYRDSIYTEKLRRKGIQYDATLEESAMRAIRVEDIQRPDVPVIQGNKRFSEVIRQLLKSRSNIIYVVEDSGKLLGSIDIHDLKEFFNEKDLYSLVLARDVAVPTKFVFPEQSLIDVMDILYLTDSEQIPIVENAVTQKFLGAVTRRDIIGAYNREVLKKKMLMAKFVTRGSEKEGIDYVEMPAGYRLGKVGIPSELENLTLAESKFRSRFGLQVLELVRPSEDGRSLRFVAEPGLRFKRGDQVIVIGSEQDFQQYLKQLGSSS